MEDDFGELYADIEIPTTNWAPQSHTTPPQPEIITDETPNNCPEEPNLRGDDVAVGEDIESDDDDDDFDVVVNDEDFEAKNGGAQVRKDAEEGVEAEFGAMEANAAGNGAEQGSGGRGGGDNVGRNCATLQYNNNATNNNNNNKYSRQCGPISTGSRRSNLGRFANGMSSPGFGEQGYGFWLPWYRTILDVDIGTLEQKPWTCPGADTTDYFNFGFDEKSWRSYCQSLYQLRQPFNQSSNQGDGNSKPELQIGQPIQVEDSSSERQPTMDVKRPRDLESDVVIQITVQDTEDPSDFVKEPAVEFETKYKRSERGRECGNVEEETKRSDDLKTRETVNIPFEENVLSQSSSSDLRRSHESATMSSHVLQNSCTQRKGHSSESDTQHSGRAAASSGRNSRAFEMLSASMEDADSDGNSIRTNPCVAGIDVSSADHVQSIATSSYTDIRSEALKNDDFSDSRDSRRFRRPSPDTVMESREVAKGGQYHLRMGRRDDIKREEDCRKYPSRTRSSSKEDWDHGQRKFRRHSDMKSHNGQDDEHYINVAKHMCDEGRSRPHHRSRHSDMKSYSGEEDDHRIVAEGRSRLHHRTRLHASDFVDEHMHDEGSSRLHHRSRQHASGFADGDQQSYRQKESLYGSDGRRSVEDQFSRQCMRDSYHQDPWGSRGEVHLYHQRRWGEDQLLSERSQQMRAGRVQREWSVEEREYTFRDEDHAFHNKPNFMSRKPHFTSRNSPSIDTDLQDNQREYINVHPSMRNKHGLSSEYGYYDGPECDRYTFNSWDGRQREYLDLEIDHEKHLRHTRKEDWSSERGDELLDNRSFDLEWPGYSREDHEYRNRHGFLSIRDHQEEKPVYAERRHHSTYRRKYTDDSQSLERIERHVSYFPTNERRTCRRNFDDRAAYDRADAVTYLDGEDYFEERRHVFHPESGNWSEDALLDANNEVYEENMLDSFEEFPRHKLHGVKHGFLPDRMIKRAHSMKSRDGVVSGRCRAKRKHPGLLGKNSTDLHHAVSQRKSVGNLSEARSCPNYDARERVDGRFQKHLRKKKEVTTFFPGKALEKTCQRAEALRGRLSIMNQDDASDLEEGQIPKRGPSGEKFKGKKRDFGHMKQTDSLTEGDSRVYDENQISETMAKMEKRRERFKKLIPVKKDIDSGPKPQVDILLETAESKGQRPARKRRWSGI